MSDLSPEARELLDSALAGLEPGDDARARVRARVAGRVAVGIAAGAAVVAATKSTAGATAATAGVAGAGAAAGGVAAAGAGAGVAAGAGAAVAGVGITAKVIASIAVVGAVAGTATYTATRHPKVAQAPMTTAQTAAPTPEKAKAPPPVAPPAPVVTVAPTTITTIPTPPIVTAPSGPASSIAEEAALLKQANAELAGGRPERALVLLDDHARRFPRGGLVEEREAARVLALCAAGRRSQGLDARDRFLREHPSSLHAARVQSACAQSSNGIQREFPQ